MFPDINRVVEITMRVEQEDEKEPQLQFRPNLVDFSDYRVKKKNNQTDQQSDKKSSFCCIISGSLKTLGCDAML